MTRPSLSRLLLAVPLSVAMAGCVPQPPAPPPARPTPSASALPPRLPPPLPVLSPDWRDMPATPGDWRWMPAPGGSTASFANGLFTISCDRAHGAITLQRAADSVAAAEVFMPITTTQGTRPLLASPVANGVAVTLPAHDRLLDDMAFSRGRFVVELAGAAPLYIPSWAEVSRVVEDCR